MCNLAQTKRWGGRGGGVNERAYGIPFIFILVLGSVNLVGWNHKLPPQPIQGDNKNNNMAQLEGGAGGGG